ncbi:MAG: hypothetical protein WD768_05180 [Phycisphaeraceae bacterium]
MNTCRVAILCLVMVTFSLAGCGDPEWTTFTANDGKFSVMFPGKPKRESSQTAGTAYTIKAGGKEFYAAFFDIPPLPRTKDWQMKVLEGGRDGSVQEAGGTLISSTPGEFLECTAIDYVAQVPSSNTVVTSKAFIKGNRIYLMTVVERKEVAGSPDVAKFFKSFSFQ